MRSFLLVSLPSDPVVVSNALGIRITCPLVGVTPVSFNRPGSPASLGKTKKATASGICRAVSVAFLSETVCITKPANRRWMTLRVT
jgi:hypothetical protein